MFQLTPAPALCLSCGHFFPSRCFGGQLAIEATFSGCTEPCPRCGLKAKVLDGTYDFAGDLVTLVCGPESTYETLAAVARILKEYDESRIDAETAKKKIDTSHPSLGQWISKQVNHQSFLPGVLAAVSVIVTACLPYFATIKAANIQASATIEAAQIQASATIEASKSQAKEKCEAASASVIQPSRSNAAAAPNVVVPKSKPKQQSSRRKARGNWASRRGLQRPRR